MPREGQRPVTVGNPDGLGEKMAYRVTWSSKAEHQLTELWLSSRTRHGITESAKNLESTLAVRPLQTGESRGGDMRIAFHYPRACRYVVDIDQELVVILAVWKHR